MNLTPSALPQHQTVVDALQLYTVLTDPKYREMLKELERSTSEHEKARSEAERAKTEAASERAAADKSRSKLEVETEKFTAEVATYKKARASEEEGYRIRLVSRFRSSHPLAAYSRANFGIQRTLASVSF
jgi:hypothetical protein